MEGYEAQRGFKAAAPQALNTNSQHRKEATGVSSLHQDKDIILTHMKPFINTATILKGVKGL